MAGTFAGSLFPQLVEQFIEVQAWRVHFRGSNAAQVTPGPGDDFFFKRQRYTGGRHDENHHTGCNTSDEVQPKDDLSQSHRQKVTEGEVNSRGAEN